MQIIANITVSTKNMLDKDSNILLVPLYVFSLLTGISTIFVVLFSNVLPVCILFSSFSIWLFTLSSCIISSLLFFEFCEFVSSAIFTLAFSNVCEF